MRRLLSRILFVLVVLGILAAAWIYWPGSAYTSSAGVLPDATEITSIELRRGTRDSIKVTVADYKQLLDSLFPARVDRWPKKWQVLGSLKIGTNEGTWSLDIYKTHEDPGGFGIWPPQDWQTYFRCRTNAELSQLLSRLQATAAEKERPEDYQQ